MYNTPFNKKKKDSDSPTSEKKEARKKLFKKPSKYDSPWLRKVE